MQFQAIIKRKGFTSSFLPKGIFNKERAGLTLVEVVVSVVIVTLTAAGIFASFIAAQNYVSRSRGRINTSNSIRQQVEALKAEVRQDVLAMGGGNLTITDTDRDDCADQGTFPAGDWTVWASVNGSFKDPPWNAQFRRCVSEAGTGSPTGQYLEVQTQIKWTEPGT